MEVILIESEALYALVGEMKRFFSGQKAESEKIDSQQEVFLAEKEVMELFGIKNRAYFSRFRSKNAIPSVKIGKNYLYRRDQLENFIQEKANFQMNPSRKYKKHKEKDI